ncbi:hypothetical protein BD779DRAFT_1522001 [Infundibulicybe gibba]|nr:hypothetical protein BD779DRAFT_1522001 [Infundibulicybe gibba]
MGSGELPLIPTSLPSVASVVEMCPAPTNQARAVPTIQMTAAEVVTRNYSSLIALVLLAWDMVLTFGDEYKYMWKRNWTPLKCVYLFCRYFSLAVQISNYVITQVLIFHVPVAHTVCRDWFLFQTACIMSLVYSVNAVLMLRVYALCSKSCNAAIFLVILFLADIISLSIQGYFCVKATVFDQACVILGNPPPVAISFSIEMLVTQGALWGMAWWKTSRSEGWNRTPVASLVVRDGAFIFVGTFGMVRCAQIVDWFISLLSFAVSRLTIDLLHLGTTGTSTQDDPELTSYIEVSLGDQHTTTGTATVMQS